MPGTQPFEGIAPFSDGAPDRWGRKILDRAAKRNRLSELEYLLSVSDHSRQGATRFIDSTGAGVGEPGTGVPIERDLPELLTIADKVQADPRSIEDAEAARLFRATGSLGGARPKATLRSGDDLWLAKFPKPDGDDWDVIGWEVATLELQRQAGIQVPEAKSISITDREGRDRHVLLLKRFDRAGATRIPYLSAMTMLEATDGDGGDWFDLADQARDESADTRELWRRAAFGSLIGNTDDHLRNHGFLRRGVTWQLSPSFDVNPTPLSDGNDHQLSLYGDPAYDTEALLAPDVLNLFGIPERDARTWMKDTAQVLAGAERAAHKSGVDEASRALMADRMRDAAERARDLAATATLTPPPGAGGTGVRRRKDLGQGGNGGKFASHRNAPPDSGS